MHEVVKHILRTYQDSWQILDWRKQRHFGYRAMQVSTDRFWKHALTTTDALTLKDLQQKQGITKKERNEYGRQRGYYLSSFKPNNPRKKMLYARYPEIIFWEEYFTSLRYWRLNGHPWQRFVPLQADCHRVASLALLPAMVRDFPVWTAERAYDLRTFYRIDMREAMRIVFGRYYHQPKTLKVKWNQVYLLTHIIIGESEYYQKPVRPDYWAVTALLEWLTEKREVGTFSVDIWAEIGICLDLAGVGSAAYTTRIHNALLDFYNPELGRLKLEQNDSLDRAEHRNSMAVLCCSQPEGIQVRHRDRDITTEPIRVI